MVCDIFISVNKNPPIILCANVVKNYHWAPTAASTHSQNSKSARARRHALAKLTLSFKKNKHKTVQIIKNLMRLAGLQFPNLG